MTSTYYRYAIAAVVVFDLERPATFDSVAKVRWVACMLHAGCDARDS